jgi:hypothetical protein
LNFGYSAAAGLDGSIDGLPENFVVRERMRFAQEHFAVDDPNDTCGALAHHGYYRIEEEVINQIRNWIAAYPPDYRGGLPFWLVLTTADDHYNHKAGKDHE